jgi:3-dehydroquinate synthetase
MTPKSLTDTILSLKQHTAQIIEISNQSSDDVIPHDICEMALTELLEIEHTIEHIEHIKTSLNTAINALDTDNKYLLKDALFSAMHAINHQSPVRSFDKYESAPSLAG